MKKQCKPRWLIKSGIICWILVPLFLSVTADAQPIADPQDHVARSFIAAVFNGNYKQAWDLFDPEAQKATPLEQFSPIARKIDSVAKGFGFGQEIMEFMRGFRTYQTGQSIWVYTYKFKGDVSKGMLPSALIDVAFKDRQTTLVYGIVPKFPALSQSQPTSNYISTSSGKEITLEKEQQWLVDNKTINVNELALILDNTTALFAIKVWDEEAKGITQQRAKEKAIPIVKYAIANGYLPKAEAGASQAKRKLSEGIGVAFIQPGTHGGYRIIIAPADIKN
ncbi:hypothetical protein [Spirosoma pollinicola]|uniref:DUF3887 domain-containing protein n=1 Tax=Spirosoma pollinicola TaxID=2057025 RepID=A0A2K8YT74_9BACT|nr:hypothetical protein [Spirosoma pollinicola]AUD00789.1 hypothetical protein CWM47_02530 [Spirosoma pollinicola]